MQKYHNHNNLLSLRSKMFSASAFEQASAYAQQLGNSLMKATLQDFFTNVHQQFYPSQDISFMPVFLEMTKQEGQFVVHHSKLREYGVMTSTESAKVKAKLDTLGMVEHEDYQLADIREPVAQGGFTISKHYHLTPQAFKKCLMRARTYAGQAVNPSVYVDYYLLLERIFGLFTTYEKLYLEKLLSIKDGTIDNLRNEVHAQSAKIDKQTAEIRKLLGYAKVTKSTLDQTKEDLSNTKASLDQTKEDLSDTKATLDQTKEDLIETKTALYEVQDDYADAREELDEIQDEFEETRETLAEVHTELVETREIAVTAKAFLEEKSFLSTMNPSDESKHHYFAATMIKLGDETVVVKFVTGQRGYVNKTIEARRALGHSVLIEPFFNANGIDLRHNACEEFRARHDAIIQQTNATRAEADRVFNAQLRREINAYNRSHDDLRVYMTEKRRTARLSRRDIPVRFTKLSFTYVKNNFISFQEARDIVTRTNETTQSSPLAP